ncbi:hypothetical protein DENSPDRAFT_844990 [Dentipellis sp. KUC8613]|nr:hypothetical protein DENSPDRAFT_844990 [Dentipellis sp. KUC8613]
MHLTCPETFFGDPLIPLGLGALAYGCFMILFILSAHILCTSSKCGEPVPNAKVYLFVAISAMFSVATAHIAIVIAFAGMWPQLQREGSTNDVVLAGRLQLVITFVPVANYLLGALVAAWRAWLLWGRKVRLFLIALWGIGIVVIPITFWKQTCYGQIVGTVLSTVDILSSVLLLALRAWRHKKFIEGELERRGKSTKAEKVLSLLLKVGVMYTVAWTLFVIAKSVPLPHLYDAMLVMLVHLTGIYPTLVVFLVYREKERRDEYFLPLTTVQFAPADTSTLNVDDLPPG